MKRAIGVFATAVALGIAGQAVAADLPIYSKAPPAAALFSWNGFYVGAHVGGGWSDSSWCRAGSGVNGCAAQVPGQNFANVDPQGALGGLQVGYNWQAGQFVLGVEGEFSLSDLKGDSPFRTFNSTYVAHSKVKDLATVGARFGYAIDRTLLYAKVGGAWADSDQWIIDTTNSVGYAKTDTSRSGWMLGAGIEYAFANNWSAKLEYNYLHFGGDNVVIAGSGGGGGTSTVSIDQNIHVVKAGLNYRFGGPY